MKLIWLGLGTLLLGTMPVTAQEAESEPAEKAEPAPVFDAQGRLTAESFAARPNISWLRISPGGTRISYVQEIDDKKNVIIATPEDPYTTLRRIQLGNEGIANVRWANEDRILLQLTRSTIHFSWRSISLIPTTRLTAIDIESGELRKIDQESEGFMGGHLLYVEPYGRWALVSAQYEADEYPSVRRVDLETGEGVRIEKPLKDVWNWTVDDEGVVRGGLARDGRKYTVYLRDQAGQEFRRIRGKFDKEEVELMEELYLSPIRGQSAVVSNHKDGRFALYKFDLEAVEPTDLLFANPGGDIDDIMVDPVSGEVLGVRYHDRRWRTHWLDEGFARLQARLDRAFPENDNELLSFSRDRNRVIIHSRRADDPGAYYVFDQSTGEMKIIGAPMPDIPEGTLAPVQRVTYEARDGLEIPAYLTLPPGKQDAKDLPLVLLPHGGPFARDEWVYDPNVQFLASRGYAVLQPQFRGTTGMGLAFVEAGYGEWGKKMQDDLDDGVDWLAAQGTIDPDRVCIYGISYGGYAALWGATRTPERYRCAISMAGISDVRAMLKYDKGYFSAKRYYRAWRDRVGGIDADKDDLRAISPIRFAKNWSVPLLIGHGMRDKNVPPDQSEEMVEELEENGFGVEQVFYKNSRHGPTREEDLVDWLKRLEAFLAKHNPA